MRIVELTAYAVQIPLRRVIKHASASRHEGENIFVRCLLADGTEGWGEGVPRSYVTGETLDGALAKFAAIAWPERLQVDVYNWRDVIRLCESAAPPSDAGDLRGCSSHALRCAVELSILDAYGRLFGEPVSNVAAAFPIANDIRSAHEEARYSAVITAEGARGERRSAIKYRCYGFHQCKVKVGIAGDDDVARLRRIRFWLGRKIDLRIDVNEAWPAESWQTKLEPLLPFQPSSVEQPIAHTNLSALNGQRGRCSVPIMLDESLTSMTDAESAVRDATCDLFNLRLSKCGGFLNSLRIAAFAKQNGLGYQLGCHPGESGVLSAAGRHWACSVADIRYLEGSYDRHLFRELLTNEDVTFRYGGRAQALKLAGLGVTIHRPTFQKFVLREVTAAVNG